MTDIVAVSGALKRFVEPGGGASSYYLPIRGEPAEALSALELAARLESGKRRGFGSLKVTVRLGEHAWQTSCFPLSGTGSDEAGWFVPVKVAYLRAEGLGEGDQVTLMLEA